MIDELKRLAQMRDEAKRAGMLGKARMADEAADVMFSILREMAERIVKLEQQEATKNAERG